MRLREEGASKLEQISIVEDNIAKGEARHRQDKQIFLENNLKVEAEKRQM